MEQVLWILLGVTVLCFVGAACVFKAMLRRLEPGTIRLITGFTDKRTLSRSPLWLKDPVFNHTIIYRGPVTVDIDSVNGPTLRCIGDFRIHCRLSVIIEVSDVDETVLAVHDRITLCGVDWDERLKNLYRGDIREHLRQYIQQRERAELPSASACADDLAKDFTNKMKGVTLRWTCGILEPASLDSYDPDLIQDAKPITDLTRERCIREVAASAESYQSTMDEVHRRQQAFASDSDDSTPSTY